MFGSQPSLSCKNCGHAILFPPSSLLEKVPNQTSWPGGWPARNVRCPNCTRVYAYSGIDLRFDRIETPEALALASGLEVRQLSFPCAESACPGRVELLFVAQPGYTHSRDTLLIGNTTLSGIFCTIAKHPYSGPCRELGATQSEPAPDWKAG